MLSYIHPDVGLGLLSTRIGFDLRGYSLDGPLPEIPKNDVIGSRSDVLVAMAKRDNLTIRQLTSVSPARVGTWKWSAPKRKSPIVCRSGLRPRPQTASMSSFLIFRAA